MGEQKQKTSKSKKFFERMREMRDDANRSSLWRQDWPKWKKALWIALVSIWTVAALYIPQLLVGYLAKLVFRAFAIEEVNRNVVQSLLTLACYVIAALLLVVLPVKLFSIAKSKREELGFAGLPTWTDILLGPCFFIGEMLITVVVMALIGAILPGLDLNESQDVGFDASGVNTPLDRVVTFLTLVVMAPIFEELMFRGWLYAKLRAHMKALPAIIIVSLMFAVAHGQLNVGIAVFVMSVAMCIQRELTGTVYSGIIVHMLKNGLAFYLLYINSGLLGV